MITVIEVIHKWHEEYQFEKIYLIGGGNKSGSKIRFLGVCPDETDPVKAAKIEYGCPDITNKDAYAFTGIDPRFDKILKLMEEGK